MALLIRIAETMTPGSGCHPLMDDHTGRALKLLFEAFY
jgi:hypothetical protein